jgi:small subunit ribosomal protein S20
VANIKSQIKRNRQNDKKRLQNRVYRGEARIAVRNARTTIGEGAPESKEALLQAVSALDKAAEKGIIHKNNAARRKSRLTKAFNKMTPAKMEEPVAAETVAEPVKKAAPRRAASKKEEPKAEPKVEPKKKAAPKAAKPAAKKTEAKKPAEKKTAAKKSSAK